MVLVAAAGNSGCAAQHRVLPPATAPSVIAVGGYDDGNDPEGTNLALYCSSFGVTADGLTKPEIIAPAMWVAAPILPGTPAYARAQALAELSATPDNRLTAAIRDIGPGTIGLPEDDGRGRTRSGPGSTASCARRRSSARTTSTWTGRRLRRRSSPRWSRRCWRRTRSSPRRGQAHPAADGRARRDAAGDPPGIWAARRPRGGWGRPRRAARRGGGRGRRPPSRERTADLSSARRRSVVGGRGRRLQPLDSDGAPARRGRLLAIDRVAARGPLPLQAPRGRGPGRPIPATASASRTRTAVRIRS